MNDGNSIESVGAAYDMAAMLDVRRRARIAVNFIGNLAKPGMVEEEAVVLAKDYLRAQGLLRGWHGVFVRFGRNTVKFYGAESEAGVVLEQNDIVIVDIGPVFGKLEGDAGNTFVVGDDVEMLRAKRDVRTVFDLVQNEWRASGLTGADLYRFAGESARSLGWELNLELNGHRIGDFPHAAFHTGALADLGFNPAPHLWVLEIHIRHPTRPFAAFYEDLLLPPEYDWQTFNVP